MFYQVVFRSVKRWTYDAFGDRSVISFVAMATPEDLQANVKWFL